MKRSMLLTAALAAATAVSAQSVRVTQIDTGALLIRGQIDAYVSLSGQGGENPKTVDAMLFSASEVRGNGTRSLEIVDVKVEAARETGIDFLLLLDNSGSMYDLFQEGGTRIEYARQALTAFFESGSGDRIALGAFNTYLHPLARLGASTGEMKRSLDRMVRPENESSYTELYMALERFLPELAQATGRKAVIVLSDGENFPFSRFSGTAHPLWGDKVPKPDDVIRRYREEEVTLYAVNFAESRDSNLARMAYETGGTVFEARDSADLTDVYTEIRETIRREVRLRIRVPAAPETERNLTVAYREASDHTLYFAPLLLGGPGGLPWFIPLLVILASVAGLTALQFVSLERPARRPEIHMVSEGTTVVLKDDVTVIGSAPDAHLSFAGNRGIDQRHATVVHDSEKGTYTLVTERPVRVNNTLVRKRLLKPGDVIGIEEATLVFDAPDDRGM